MAIKNPRIKSYDFLEELYRDAYFPNVCVDKVKAVLLKLSAEIEYTRPADLKALYKLTHAATRAINALEQCFEKHGSEIETGAREAIARDFEVVADAYGFEADIEALIAPRDW